MLKASIDSELFPQTIIVSVQNHFKRCSHAYIIKHILTLNSYSISYYFLINNNLLITVFHAFAFVRWSYSNTAEYSNTQIKSFVILAMSR